MRSRIAVAALAFALVGAVGCGTATVATTGTQGSAAPTWTAKSGSAHIGTAILLRTQDGALRVRLLATKWRATVKEDQWTTDKNVQGIEFELVNTGKTVYSDSPSNCVQLVDADDVSHGPTLMVSLPATFAQVTMAPGARRVGWVWFEGIAKGKAKSVQFTPNSGFADETGQWLLK